MTTSLSQAEKQAIFDGLMSPDGEVRRLSVEKLPMLPIVEAVPHMADRLGDEVWRVRKAAVERLVHCIDHPSVQEILIASLGDGEDPGRRNSAFEALVACGSRVTSRLVQELQNPDVDVRKLVVDALAGIADPESRDPLAAAILDPDTNVRAAVVEALGMVGGSEEIDPILHAVNRVQEDLLVRLSALRALVRLEACVSIEMLGTALDESALRPAALTVLGFSNDESAVEVMLKALSSTSQASREASMGALLRKLSSLDGAESLAFRERLRDAARASETLVETVVERLDACSLGIRMTLVQFLGLLGDPRTVVPILEVGRDEAIRELSETTLENLGEIVPVAIAAGWEALDADLRRRACAVLGRIGGSKAEHRLVEALDADDSELRCAAAAALGQGAFLDCLPDLTRRLETVAGSDQPDSQDEIDVLMTAIVGMAERTEAVEAGLDSQLIEALASRLIGAPEPVRLAIAQVLARLGRPQDQDIVSYLLKDESPAVRRSAVHALARFEYSRSRDSLRLALSDESESVRTAAACALGDVEDIDAAIDLERLTHDEDPRVAAVAFRSIGHLHHRLSLRPDHIYSTLERGLAASALVTLASLEALMEIGGARAAELAASTIGRTEPEVVRAAIACVDAHGSEESLAAVLALVPHQDWSVRAEVARVLAERGYRKGLPALLRRLDLEDDVFVREAVLSAIRGLED